MFTMAKFQATSVRGILYEFLKITLFYLAQVPMLILFGVLGTIALTPPVAEIQSYFLPIFVGIVFAAWFVVLIAIDLFEAFFGVDLLLMMRFWKYLPKKPIQVDE